ncbi:MAG: helix-turn-helix transcriptional regulator [Planctomycetaceae bacterium]
MAPKKKHAAGKAAKGDNKSATNGRKSAGIIGGRNAKVSPAVSRHVRRTRISAAEMALAKLADEFQSLREQKGMSVAQVAKASEVAPQSIIQFENRTRPMMFDKLHAIAAALGHDLVLTLRPK